MQPVRMTRQQRRNQARHSEKQPSNGHYHGPIPPPPVQAGPPPRTEVWVSLADEYPGWQFYMWRNHPRAIRQALFTATDEATRIGLMKQIVRAHNGWTNHEGQEYPPATEDEFWREIPDEVFSAVWHRLRAEAVLALPNSLTGMSATSVSTSASSEAEPTPQASMSPGSTSSDETSPESGESEVSSD